MSTTQRQMSDSIEILIGELMDDDELRRSFMRDPERTLQLASDWGLPLSETELDSLRGPSYRLWDDLVEELEARITATA